MGANVEVKSLTPAQLAAIFTGKITDWREVGGPQGPIRLFIRDSADTSLRGIQFHLEEFRDIPFSPENKLVYYDYEMVQMLKKYRNGIGMLTNSSFYGDSSIKALAIDGIRPSPENVKSGNYKITVTFAFCFKKGQLLPELARSFIAFVFQRCPGNHGETWGDPGCSKIAYAYKKHFFSTYNYPLGADGWLHPLYWLLHQH